jgi:hypothetical protein
MTIIDAMGSVLAGLAFFFTSPLMMAIVAVFILAAGVALVSTSFGGFHEGDYVLASLVMIVGIFLIFVAVSMGIWVTSSSDPLTW